MSLSIAKDWWTGHRSGRWDAVEARVIVSERSEARLSGSDGTEHLVPELLFRYRYEVDDRAFEAERLSFTKNEIDVRDIDEFIEQHPVGSSVLAYHDPRHPEQAVMDRGVPLVGVFFPMLPALFVPVGIFLIWGSATGAIVRFCERHGLWYR